MVAFPTPPLQFHLTAIVKPYDSWLEVLSLTGEVDGHKIHAPHPDGLLMDAGIHGDFNDIKGPIPFAPGVPPYLQFPNCCDVRFSVGQGQYFFGFDDFITGSMYLGHERGPDLFGGPVTWNATEVVATPETWLLLGVGIFALLVMKMGEAMSTNAPSLHLTNP